MTHPFDTTAVHLDYIRKGIDRIEARMDAQSIRMDRVEDSVVALETSVAVLQDRATEARMTARSTGMLWGSGAGAAAAWMVDWVYQHLTQRGGNGPP